MAAAMPFQCLRCTDQEKGFHFALSADSPHAPEHGEEPLASARELTHCVDRAPLWEVLRARQTSLIGVLVLGVLCATVASAALLLGARPARSRLGYSPVLAAADPGAQAHLAHRLQPLVAAQPREPPAAQDHSKARQPAEPAEPAKLSTTVPQAKGQERPQAAEVGDPCKGEDSLDYQTDDRLYEIAYIPSYEICQMKCKEDSRCGAWSWGKSENVVGLANVCFLKQLAGGKAPLKHENLHVISGLPCRGAPPAFPQKATTSVYSRATAYGTSTTVAPQSKVKYSKTPATLYCWSLMMPDSYEEGLLAWQYRYGAGIFGCDEAAVYSNRTIQVTPGLTTKVVGVNLHCDMGGEFGTALNTDIFRDIWQQVFDDGHFALHGWTVKADPDTVFFASRLRTVVKTYGETQRGVYLNNCKMGMHGPLEVFSRNAVRSWVQGAATCYQYFYKLCSGPCLWGEDMFIDQCLGRKLLLDRENQYNLLTEDHCDPPPGWQSCSDIHSVAFHPFKNLTSYQRCLKGSSPADYPYLIAQK